MLSLHANRAMRRAFITAASTACRMSTAVESAAIREMLEGHSGYRHRHGLDVPGSRASDPIQQAQHVSGSGAIGARTLQDGSLNPNLRMDMDARYHSSFPADDAPHSPSGLLNLDKIVDNVHKLRDKVLGHKKLDIIGENQTAPITGAATKTTAQSSAFSQRRNFSTGTRKYDSKSSGAPSIQQQTPPSVIDTADEADIAKMGTSNYRPTGSSDHPYTNIDMHKRIAHESSGETPAASHQSKTAELRRDLRDTEASASSSSKKSSNNGNLMPPYSTSTEYFPESMHLEPNTAGYFEDASKRRQERKTVKSGAKQTLEQKGFYPETMILEPEVRAAIPPEGLPKPTHGVGYESLASNLHDNAGYFYDTGVSDPYIVNPEGTSDEAAKSSVKGKNAKDGKPRMM